VVFAQPYGDCGPFEVYVNSVTTTSFTLNWTSSANATGYSVFIYYGDGITPIPGESGSGYGVGAATSYPVTGLTSGTTYMVTVISGAQLFTDAIGNNNFSNVTTQSDIPSTPTATAASSVTQNSFSANWDASASATKYYLDVATDVNFASILTSYNNLDVGNVTTYPVTGLTFGTAYYYRVRAYNTYGISGSSSPITLTTLLPPPPSSAPTSATPSNGAIVSGINLTLQWSPVSTATSYTVQLSTSPTFSSYIVNVSGINGTSYLVNGLSNNTQYYWRVSAENAGGSSGFGNTWNFKTLGNPTQPVLIYPSANSVNIPVTLNFEWNQSQDQLMMAMKNGILKNANSIAAAGTPGEKKPAFISEYWFELTTDTTNNSYIVKYNSVVDTVETVSGLKNLTNYWWRVSAVNETGMGAFTNWSNFTTVIDTPGVVQQVSPLDASLGNIRPVKLRWLIPVRAASFRLQFGTDSTFATTMIDTSGLTDTSFTLSGLNNLTKYYWRVNAANAGGTSPWSFVWNFKTLGNPTEAVLIYPAANSINVPVTVNFEWNQSQDQLMLAKNNGILKNANTISSAGSTGKKGIAAVSRYWFELTTDTTSSGFIVNDNTSNDTTYMVTGLQNLTNYWWRVSAMNEAGWGNFTGWSNFTTVIDTPGAVQQVSPLNGNLGNIQPVQLKWMSSARAGSCRLQFGTDSTFTSTIIDSSGLSGTTFTLSSLNSLTTYYWRVNASNAGGTSGWSTVWNFKTLGYPAQASIIYPAINSSCIPLTLNFEWNKFRDQIAMADLKGFMKNEKSITGTGSSGKKNTASVSRYWFELMTDTTSENYVVNDSTVSDTTIQVTGLKNLTNYLWRVKGLNEAGWGSYTNWYKFTTIIDTPGVTSLLTTNSGSAISDTASSILFKWESAPFAGTYEVQIASDNKFNALISDTAGIPDTVFMYHPKKLSSSFYWKVRAINIAGQGAWSAVMNISVITGINNIKNGVPVVYNLYQNYPNPFNPGTIIGYALPFSSNVKIEIYNILGVKVKELLNGQKTAGYYSINLNTTGLASGVYLYMIEAKSLDGKSEYMNTKKMLLLK